MRFMVAFACYIHKILFICSYAVDIEKFAQTVEIQFFPKGDLSLSDCERFYHYFWRTNAFPITYKLHHTHLEYEHVVLFFRQSSEIEKRALWYKGFGFENYVGTCRKTEFYQQSVVGLFVRECIITE